MSTLFVLTGLSSALGAVVFMVSAASAQSAPQEAAGAAMAIALAVIPYVFARCIQIAKSESLAKQRHEEIVAAIRLGKEGASSPVEVARTNWA